MSATKPPPGYDDRFVVPLEPSRRGAHRARVSPLIGALPVVAVVAVVAVVIVLAWTLFGRQTSGTGAAAGSGVTSQAAPGGSTPTATAGGPTATASSQPTTTPTQTATGGTGAALNQTISVTVLNTTGRNGLAAKVATLLVGKGWTGAKSAKTVVTPRSTTVYYVTNEQKAEADAIVTDLGVGVAKKSTTMGTTGITVVLGSDYPTTG